MAGVWSSATGSQVFSMTVGKRGSMKRNARFSWAMRSVSRVSTFSRTRRSVDSAMVCSPRRAALLAVTHVVYVRMPAAMRIAGSSTK